MPAGTLGQNSFASAAVTHAAAAASRSTFSVPAGILVDGTNVVSASVHANYRNTPDLSFDLSFTAERGAAPVAPGPVGGLTATATAHDAVSLSWTAPDSGSGAGSVVTETVAGAEARPPGPTAVTP